MCFSQWTFSSYLSILITIITITMIVIIIVIVHIIVITITTFFITSLLSSFSLWWSSLSLWPYGHHHHCHHEHHHHHYHLHHNHHHKSRLCMTESLWRAYSMNAVKAWQDNQQTSWHSTELFSPAKSVVSLSLTWQLLSLIITNSY